MPGQARLRHGHLKRRLDPPRLALALPRRPSGIAVAFAMQTAEVVAKMGVMELGGVVTALKEMQKRSKGFPWKKRLGK